MVGKVILKWGMIKSIWLDRKGDRCTGSSLFGDSQWWMSDNIILRVVLRKYFLIFFAFLFNLNWL